MKNLTLINLQTIFSKHLKIKKEKVIVIRDKNYPEEKIYPKKVNKVDREYKKLSY